MVREGSWVPAVKTVVLAAALLACPCAMLAQRGAGGGSTGGGTAGGGGLSGRGGRATGVDTKDDLKGFHLALAVQATSQQIIEYNLMMKSTEAAAAGLQAFVEQLGKQNNVSELAGRDAIVDRAIEKARTANKKFLDGFSERQKSGLKEITKKLTKADADLEQQVKALDQTVGDAKAVGQQIAGSAQNLEHTLTSFRSQQVDLGEEMSIGAPQNGEDLTFSIPRLKSSVNFANQPVSITTSGVVSRGTAEGGQSIFKLELTADLSDLQREITEVLHAQLDKADRCGERIEIHNATLTPRGPASLVVVQLHFERWTCLGRQTMNEMVEGDGTIEVKLTPVVGEDGMLRLAPEIGRVDADGVVGELLRSGSLGDAVRDKITDSILSAVRQGGDFKVLLPPTAQGNARLRHAQFQGTGSGRLMVVLEGEIRVSNEQATALTGELRGRSAAHASSQETTQQTVPR
jgi:hypothetical protein